MKILSGPKALFLLSSMIMKRNVVCAFLVNRQVLCDNRRIVTVTKYKLLRSMLLATPTRYCGGYANTGINAIGLKNMYMIEIGKFLNDRFTIE